MIFLVCTFHTTHGPKHWTWTFFWKSVDTYLLLDLARRMAGADFEVSEPGEGKGEGGRVLLLL